MLGSLASAERPDGLHISKTDRSELFGRTCNLRLETFLNSIVVTINSPASRLLSVRLPSILLELLQAPALTHNSPQKSSAFLFLTPDTKTAKMFAAPRMASSMFQRRAFSASARQVCGPLQLCALFRSQN